MKFSLRSIPVKRVLKIAAGIAVALLLLVVIALAALPALVNSSSVQARVQKTLASAMTRPVGWSQLSFSWSGGLLLSGLKLGDGAAPLLNSTIDQLVCTPGFSRGSDGRYGVDLTLKVHNIHAELAPGPAKPPPPPSGKDPLTQLAEAIQKVQGLDFPLPLDVRLLIEVAPLNVVYRVPPPGKPLQIKDFSLRLAMPSLASQPIIADIKGGVTVNGNSLGPVGLSANISKLVTSERHIRPVAALCDLNLQLPGSTLSLGGGLSQRDGIAARWQLDLPRVLALGHPFLPHTTPRATGTVDVRLTAKANTARDITAELTVAGNRLAASGGSLKEKRVGPLDMTLRQQVVTDHVRQQVDFPGGQLTIPGIIDGNWRASVTQPTLPSRSTAVTLGPLKLELAGALAAAAPFLPANSPVKDLAGAITLRSLAFGLRGPTNDGTVTVEGFAVTVQKLKLALVKGELTASDVELMLDKLHAPLVAKQPTKLLADLHWRVGKGALTGAQPLTLHGGRGTFALDVASLNLKSSSPRKVSAAATLRQSLDVEHLSSGAAYTVDALHEQLQLQAQATDSGVVTAQLPEFMLSAAAVKGVSGGKKYGPLPLFSSLTVADLLLPAAGGRPTVRHAAAKISAGDFLQLAADAVLSTSVVTTGTARFDLQRALPLLTPFVPVGLKASGLVSTAWNVALPLTETKAAASLPPLQKLKADLARLEKCDVTLKLDNIAATVPSGKNKIQISGLRSSPDLQVTVTKNGDAARFDGGLIIAGLSGLPGSAAKLPSQHGSLLLTAELSGWKSLRISEELHVEPLGISQDAELNANRLDSLLDEKQPYSTAALVKRLDATLFATLAARFSKDLTQLLPGVELAGSASTALRADLTAGRELALRYSLKTNDFGVKLANGTIVEGMRTDIGIQRVYTLLALSQAERWTPLSNALVRPMPVNTANPGAAEIVGRINDDLRGDARGSRSFSIRRIVSTGASGVPLELTALEGDLLFTREQAGISFFQGDLLGGTLLARGVFDLRPEVPVLAAGSSFSNLDVSLLLPKETRQRQGAKNAEITGELSLAAPLTPEQRELFEQLRLTANVRKIGADTIERALFSLDPYERNEQVVAQRKMLRLGGLKSLRATAVDGAFGMEGEAHIKGVVVDLPKVERLRISELPMRQELVKNRKSITALRGILDLVRADTLVISPKGEVSLQRRSHDK